MRKQVFLSIAILAASIPSMHANTESRRATIIGGGGGIGKCTIEVSVDDGAEVEVTGDMGLLRTISGQTATWRRFQCSTGMPLNPGGFRFVKVRGRGSAQLIGDPRSNGGRAVVHISDPKGGRENYIVELQWRGSGGVGPVPGPPPPSPGRGPGPGRFPMAKAIRICQDSVTDRLTRDGYSAINFQQTIPDNNPGRNDWVIGRVTGDRGFGTKRFSFSCSVDFSSGRVRSVDVHRR
jgi:hypothetical protein